MLTRRFSLITALLLLATAARLYQIQAQSIWFDEGWSAYAASQPTLIAAVQADATNPPLYYLLLNLAARAFGTSEFALRTVSLLIGLLIIPLVYQLARRTLNPSAGLYAAALAAISAPLWWASQEARMYSLLALLILIAALAWQQIITRPTRAAWAALWLSELALLYAHNTGPVAALWLNAVTLLIWVARRRPRPSVWIVGQIGVGLLWLPYFASRYLLLQAANSAVSSAPQIGLPLLGQLWEGFWIAPWALAEAQLPSLIIASLLVLLIALLVLRALFRRGRWLIAHVMLLTTGLIAGLMLLGNDLHGRYLVMIVPLLIATVAVGLASLPRRLRALALIPFVLLFGIDLIVAQNPDYQHDDARAMVQYYADHLTAADTVIDWSYADRYDLAYYWDRLGVQAKRVTLPEGADLDAVLPLLPASGDVALNVWYGQRADYRGMMGCVLGSGTTDLPESYTVYGMTSQLYHAPTLDLAPLQSTDWTFTDSGGNSVARVDAVGQVPLAAADRALCLPIQITLLRKLDADLKAALMVQNDLGWTVARADAIFATANQRTSAALSPGELLTAYPLLRLPYGAPPGSYHLLLRLYDETENPSGYNPPTQSGRDLPLADWTALPGADWSQVNRATDLPNRVDLAVSGDLTLLADDLAEGTVHNGDEIRASLLWQGAGAVPDLELADEGGAWQVEAPASVDDHGAITLDWRAIRVPADAPSGSAVLRLGGWAILARYSVELLPLLTEAPPFETPVGADFPGVGELVGYTLSDPPYSREYPPQITLVWRAGDAPTAIPYTVTVQLIDAAGQVIAQDDSLPGGRSTTGWRAGEYIVDPHTLSFNTNAVPGAADLIAALYDAGTGNRVRLTDGTDAVRLVSQLEVR